MDRAADKTAEVEMAADAEAAADAVLVLCCFTGQMVTAAVAKDRQEMIEDMEDEYGHGYGDAASPQGKQHLQRNRTRRKKSKKKK